jgi:hypothetical protein
VSENDKQIPDSLLFAVQVKHRQKVVRNRLCVCSRVAAGAAALADLDFQIQIFVYFEHLTAVLHDNVKTVGRMRTRARQENT